MQGLVRINEQNYVNPDHVSALSYSKIEYSHRAFDLNGAELRTPHWEGTVIALQGGQCIECEGQTIEELNDLLLGVTIWARQPKTQK